MIRYDKAFESNVGGRLMARFKRDAQKRPVFHPETRGGQQMRHYEIELGLESPAEQVSSVTYVLDNSYYDPVREARNRTDNFKEDITSYGDYTMEIKAEVGRRVYVQKVRLSELLEEGHKDELTQPEIRDAIIWIKHH